MYNRLANSLVVNKPTIYTGIYITVYFNSISKIDFSVNFYQAAISQFPHQISYNTEKANKIQRSLRDLHGTKLQWIGIQLTSFSLIEVKTKLPQFHVQKEMRNNQAIL